MERSLDKYLDQFLPNYSPKILPNEKPRERHDAVLIGARKFLKDRGQCAPLTRVIMDPRGRIFEALRLNRSWLEILERGPQRTYILTDVFDDDKDLMAAEHLLDTESVIVINHRFDDKKSWLAGALFQLELAFENREDRKLKKLMIAGGAM